jgi:hypothetical protein
MVTSGILPGGVLPSVGLLGSSLFLALGQALFQVVDVLAAGLEALVAHDPLLQRDVGLDAVHHHFAQRHAHARDRGGFAVGPCTISLPIIES